MREGKSNHNLNQNYRRGTAIGVIEAAMTAHNPCLQSLLGLLTKGLDNP
jgi:hypothetical protein